MKTFRVLSVLITGFLVLAGAANADSGNEILIEGSRDITESTDYTDFFTIGTDTEKGTLNIVGTASNPITVTTTGFKTYSDARSINIGAYIKNGTITVTNATFEAKNTGVWANATGSNSAELIVNEGGTVITGLYPGAGQGTDHFGKITLNPGSKLISNAKAIYCGLAGSATMKLNDADVEANGLHVARQDVNSSTFTMHNGSMKLTNYLTMAMYGGSSEEKAVHGLINLSSDKPGEGIITVGSFLVMAARTGDTNGTFNMRGYSSLDVTGTVNIGNGENFTEIVADNAGKGTFNLYDSASVTAKSYVGIGANSSLNLYGGTFQTTGAVSNKFENAGTINIYNGAKIDVAGIYTNTGTVNIAAGGELNINGNAATCESDRPNNAGLLLRDGTMNVSGTVTVKNYTDGTKASGIVISGAAGTDATMVVNAGGVVNSGSYVWIGQQSGESGSLYVNGGTFNSMNQALYVGYRGNGYVELNNGTLYVDDNFQIARNWGGSDENDNYQQTYSHGEVVVKGSDSYLYAGENLIVGYWQAASGVAEQTVGRLTMNAGKAKVGYKGSGSLQMAAAGAGHEGTCSYVDMLGNSSMEIKKISSWVRERRN